MAALEDTTWTLNEASNGPDVWRHFAAAGTHWTQTWHKLLGRTASLPTGTFGLNERAIAKSSRWREGGQTRFGHSTTYLMCFGNSLPGIKPFSNQSCEVGQLPTLSLGPAIEESVGATSGPCSGAAFAEPRSPESAGFFVRPLPRQFCFCLEAREGQELGDPIT